MDSQPKEGGMRTSGRLHGFGKSGGIVGVSEVAGEWAARSGGYRGAEASSDQAQGMPVVAGG